MSVCSHLFLASPTDVKVHSIQAPKMQVGFDMFRPLQLPLAISSC